MVHSLSFTAPFMTAADLQQERESLSDAQVAAIQKDLYGGGGGEPTSMLDAEDNSTMLPSSLVPPGSILEQAQNQAPELVDQETPWHSYRAACQTDEEAVQQLCNYWDMRYRIFASPARADGRQLWLMPMTLRGAMNHPKDDDFKALRTGGLCILPQPDAFGRAILGCDFVRLVNVEHSLRFSFGRLCMYMLHRLSQNVHARQHGFVVVFNLENFEISKHADRVRFREFFFQCTQCIPVKIKAVHLLVGYGRGPLVLRLVLPSWQCLWTPHVRLRHVIHVRHRQNNNTYASLQDYGIPQDALPQTMGGCCNTQSDFEEWLNRQRQLEYEATTTNHHERRKGKRQKSCTGMHKIPSSPQESPSLRDLFVRQQSSSSQHSTASSTETVSTMHDCFESDEEEEG